MNIGTLRFVYSKWFSCGQKDCYEVNRSVFLRGKSRFRDLALNNDFEIRMCLACRNWVPKR